MLTKIIPLFSKFNTQDLNLKVIEDELNIGGFMVKAHEIDHSMAGSCAYEARTDGKTLIYTGDIRFHGISAWKSARLAKSVKNPDYLVMEGTTLGGSRQNKTGEADLIPAFEKIFKGDKLPLVQFSPQNLDRFITIYKACLKAKKILVIDPYTCYMLEVYGQLSKKIPQLDKNNIRVYFAKNSITKKLAESKKLYKYKSKKILFEEIVAAPQRYVVKGNHAINKKLLKAVAKENLTIIHSMWKGYLAKPGQFDDYTDIITCIHASGHAYVENLQRFTEKINPRNIIPIHTGHKQKYAELFSANIIVLNDGEALEL
jgi:ribonuclease J